MNASQKLQWIYISALFPVMILTQSHAGMPKHLGPGSHAPELNEYKTVFHVDGKNGSGKRKSGSKKSPWATITTALKEARKEPGPRAILVAEGHYSEGTITLEEGEALFGGFSSKDWTRGIMEHPTVLDGQRQGRVMVLHADSITVDGFHIINGEMADYGAGVLCDGVSPQITNNVFQKNRVLAPEGWNPKYRHELAKDGAAIACLNGASPVIAHNIFMFNETVIGRGAAVTAHRDSHPQITNNVIMHNVVGIDDPKRSSEGAISAYGYSDPLIEGNLVAMNRAENSNDAGGIFIALWANPVIRHNWILGNYCDDDGAGLFIGGQEHRYDTPLDPVPPPSKFEVLVEKNIFMGNRNRTENSGAMRITMETRGNLINNIVAHNHGGVYLQRSEMKVFHNTIKDNLLMVETKHTVGPSDVRNNLILDTADIQAPTRYTHNASRNFTYGEGNFVIMEKNPGFREDGFTASIATMKWLPEHKLTQVDIFAETPLEGDFSGRVIRIGNFWSVVESNTPLRFFVWGQAPDAEPNVTRDFMEILPTYRPVAGASFLDRGDPGTGVMDDFEGNPRPGPGAGEDRPDLGAYELQK